MEPPKGFWATLWSFLRFLPFFLGLLLLGIVKGALLCPSVCLIVAIGNSAIILGLWPAHAIWTYYCIVRAKQLGPLLKLVLCIGILILVVLWPLVGILASILGGAGYGFLAPVIATFEAVGEGRSNDIMHCLLDGIRDTIKGSFTVVRDTKDVCFHSYFSVMDDIRCLDPPSGRPYEIRLHNVPGAFIVGVLGIMVDLPMITLVALCKSPYMLFKGWNRLFHDLIGREGPFLETACVPFAGLSILLWPLAVAGAVVASIISSIFLGGYAAVVAYQESSIRMGLAYIMASLSIFDEYSNDFLDMPEGSIIPRPQYRKKETVGTAPLSRPTSFNREKQDIKTPLSRTGTLKDRILEIKPLKLLEQLFTECKRYGEALVAEGVVTIADIEESRSNKDKSKVISIGLPAYSLLQTLLRSSKANSEGLVLSDGTEITTMNRPKDTFFDWFFDPLMILKQQIKVENFTEEEDNCLCKLVLLHDDAERLKNLSVGSLLQNERRRAEIDAFARRLRGITKSISRYPTAKRRFGALVKSLSEELERKMGGSQSVNGSQTANKPRGSFTRLCSQSSFAIRTDAEGENEEAKYSEITLH